MPIPVLSFWYFCPIPVLAWYITGTGIKWWQYRYWHICSFVQYQYWHGTLPVLPLLGAHTGIGILVLWFIISIGTVHYWYWHLMVPVPLMAFMHLCPLPLSAWYITVTDIKWCQNWYWHICMFVEYQYWHGTFLVLALNGAHAGIRIYAFWSRTSISMVHYRYRH